MKRLELSRVLRYFGSALWGSACGCSGRTLVIQSFSSFRGQYVIKIRVNNVIEKASGYQEKIYIEGQRQIQMKTLSYSFRQ
jgi:hypothetical protein